ncbi:MAG: MFS transporter [Chloroflexota bacterium]|nr:MFS transporter [Chloroflexota bacterium]
MNRRSNPVPSDASSQTSPGALFAGLPAGSRGALLAALLAVFIGALDLTVIAAILPWMVTDLRVNTADIDRYVWIVNAYLLAYIIAIPIVGRVSDLVGRTTAFQASLAVFVIGSVWCALAPDLGWMIAGRAVQGAGGGALLPVTMALVGDLLPPARRIAALGVVGAVDTLGWVLGPLWGAAVVGIIPGDEAWRWVFIVNVPVCLIAAVAILRSGRGLGRGDSTGWLRRLDLGGSLLLALSLLLLNLGLSSGGEVGAPDTGSRALGGTQNPLSAYLVPLLVGAVLLGGGFIWWEHRASTPLLPLALFRNRRFAAAIAANGIVGAALIVAMVDVPVMVALIVPESQVSTVSALMLAPFTLFMAILSFGGGVIAGRLGARWTAAAGLVLVATGYALLWFTVSGGDFLRLIPGLTVAGAGFGLVVAPIGATAIDAAPADDRGIAAAMVMVFRLLGMTIGMSALTAVAVQRLQSLVGGLEAIVQSPGETTAEFLARQTEFLESTVLPLSLQVVRETFLIAGVIALLALIPVMRIGSMARQRGDQAISGLKPPS